MLFVRLHLCVGWMEERWFWVAQNSLKFHHSLWLCVTTSKKLYREINEIQSNKLWFNFHNFLYNFFLSLSLFELVDVKTLTKIKRERERVKNFVSSWNVMSRYEITFFCVCLWWRQRRKTRRFFFCIIHKINFLALGDFPFISSKRVFRFSVSVKLLLSEIEKLIQREGNMHTTQAFLYCFVRWV